MTFPALEIPAGVIAAVATQLAWQPLLHGIGLGLGAAVPIGPVNVEIARRALRFGAGAGLALGLGAVTVDVIYAVLSTFSFVVLLNQPAIMLPIAGGGALLLAYLGVQCLRAARAAWQVDPLEGVSDRTPSPEDRPAAAAVRRSYVTGFLMTLLNPMTLAFWFTVVPAMGTRPGTTPNAAAATSQAAGGELPMMCAGVFLGTLAWVLFFSAVLAHAGRAAGTRPDRRRRWLAIADLAGGLVLICFALIAGIGFWRRMGLVL